MVLCLDLIDWFELLSTYTEFGKSCMSHRDSGYISSHRATTLPLESYLIRTASFPHSPAMCNLQEISHHCSQPGCEITWVSREVHGSCQMAKDGSLMHGRYVRPEEYMGSSHTYKTVVQTDIQDICRECKHRHMILVKHEKEKKQQEHDDKGTLNVSRRLGYFICPRRGQETPDAGMTHMNTDTLIFINPRQRPLVKDSLMIGIT